jgi:hypothetical protein
MSTKYVLGLQKYVWFVTALRTIEIFFGGGRELHMYFAGQW